MIYREFTTWKKGLEYRSGMVLKGIYGLIFLSLIIGMVSLFYYVIRQVNAFYRRETTAACIITAIFLLMSVGWLGTFINERHHRVEAQYTADSLAYDLSKFTQMYDSTSTTGDVKGYE